MKKKASVYESPISTARWMAYDLPGNLGWIAYLAGLVLSFRRGATALTFAALVPAALMLLGIGELIAERIRRLDRVLPAARLFRGFGALILGGLLGVPCGAVGMAIGPGGAPSLLMLCGAALCALFAWLIFREYHPRDDR